MLLHVKVEFFCKGLRETFERKNFNSDENRGGGEMGRGEGNSYDWSKVFVFFFCAMNAAKDMNLLKNLFI